MNVQCLINNYMFSACWNDNIVDIWDKYNIIKINVTSFFFNVNMATRTFKIIYMTFVLFLRR